eukprot:m.241855 g.241855  ORF g.241855 m.241855 type:complete len:539 (-) comp24853_c0_seq1:248-1864(-)
MMFVSFALALLLAEALATEQDNTIGFKQYYESDLLPDLLPGERVRTGPQWRWGDWAHGRTGVVAGNAEPPGWYWVRWDHGPVNAYRYFHKTHDLEPLPAQPTPAPRVTWPGSAAAVAAGEVPVILTDTPADNWAAHAWTPTWLAANMHEPLSGVKVTPRGKDATVFHYFHASPMSSLPATAAAKARAYTRASNMTMQEFLVQSGILSSGPSAKESHGLHVPALDEQSESVSETSGVNSTHALAYAAMLHDWGLEFARQVLPLHPFLVLPAFNPKTDNLQRQTRVWVSPANTHTPGHFDLFHNFYVQLHGRKRFLLWPPESSPYLYLHPVLHPCGRATQVDLLSGTHDANFPLFSPDRIAPIVADLEPGDVLYLPPLWFHYVMSLTDSVSVSVWSLYDATETAAKAAEEVVLPVARSWPLAYKVAALRIFLDKLITSVQSLSSKDFVRTELLETRYLHQPCPTETSFCHSASANEAVLQQGSHLIQQQLKAATAIFEQTLLEGTSSRLPIYLADYVEIAANTIVGPAQVCSLLSAFANC